MYAFFRHVHAFLSFEVFGANFEDVDGESNDERIRMIKYVGYMF